MITTIRLTEQDLIDKAAIEQSLQGAKLTHYTIYRRGLNSFMEAKIVSNNVANENNSVKV